ncbi:hypothetical protein O0I10_003936 [Lichtheimia ornata]|uniref:DUF218 domain-containing protein n=1 Tax=Lichtheimia ornata TaxID=688661 RepID=A0AAD7V8C4_9FUNG|nr:uncharacterized protein O0I10_003936 [Lichtheimia ornata]KAJ8660478.1 hypothetical protein O0I10_003936 [Lichtheimia ornata]
MAAAANNGKRKVVTVLPLHIDTTSFTNPQQPITYPWRRIINKRQLPFLILFVFFIFSIAINFIQHERHRGVLTRTSSLTPSISDPLPRAPLEKLQRAIIVPGHAIYTGDSSLEGLEVDDNWVLESFQRGGQVRTFVRHIEKAIEMAKEDPEAVVIFSGGQTRAHAGPQSEGQSYWQIANSLIHKEAINDTTTVDSLTARMIVEDYARDSHENLLFSICRFQEMTGQYPSSITVVGFEFKRTRFEEMHLRSLRYPEQQFRYIGIDPPFDPVGTPERSAGEAANSLGPLKKDPYGCHYPLVQKRIDRNPFRRRHPYRLTCPALSDIINYCPEDNQFFQGRLPWDN